MRRGQKSLNGFKFGTFISRFPSDGAASMAVKGLKPPAGSVKRARQREPPETPTAECKQHFFFFLKFEMSRPKLDARRPQTIVSHLLPLAHIWATDKVGFLLFLHFSHSLLAVGNWKHWMCKNMGRFKEWEFSVTQCRTQHTQSVCWGLRQLGNLTRLTCTLNGKIKPQISFYA